MLRSLKVLGEVEVGSNKAKSDTSPFSPCRREAA